MSGRKFPLVYDDKFDRDIYDLLQQTPDRRRSERIRHLIRLGLAAESMQGRLGQTIIPPNVSGDVSTNSASSVVASNQPDQRDTVNPPRERRPHRFAPPEE